MWRDWPGLQKYSPNDALSLCLVALVLVIGAPVIALILKGFRRDYDQLDSDQRKAWEAHIQSIKGNELKLREESAARTPSDDWGFWTLEDSGDILQS